MACNCASIQFNAQQGEGHSPPPHQIYWLVCMGSPPQPRILPLSVDVFFLHFRLLSCKDHTPRPHPPSSLHMTGTMSIRGNPELTSTLRSSPSQRLMQMGMGRVLWRNWSSSWETRYGRKECSQAQPPTLLSQRIRSQLSKRIFLTGWTSGGLYNYC